MTKDTPEELRAKKAAHTSRLGGTGESLSQVKCSSCESTEHSSKRNRSCPNHDFTLRVERALGKGPRKIHSIYSISHSQFFYY